MKFSLALRSSDFFGGGSKLKCFPPASRIPRVRQRVRDAGEPVGGHSGHGEQHEGGAGEHHLGGRMEDWIALAKPANRNSPSVFG